MLSQTDHQTKIETLVRQLYSMTKQGKLQWELTAEKGTYLTGLTNHTVQIHGPYAEEGQFPMDIAAQIGDYVLSVHDAQGQLVEQFRIPSRPASVEGVNLAELIRSLFEQARTQANRDRDKVLDDLLRELQTFANGRPSGGLVE